MIRFLAAILVYAIGAVLVYAAFAFVEFKPNPHCWYFGTRVLFVVAQCSWAVALIAALVSE